MNCQKTVVLFQGTARQENIISIESANVRLLGKPWGRHDLRPWFTSATKDQVVGEVWLERPATAASSTALLFKLLFTNEPLSIQVHPTDEFARGMGLANGKTEAWYVLSAAPDAKVAIGLTVPRTPRQLRIAIEDGSIAELVHWQGVTAGDVVYVPAGTIHAIGPGLVIAEIQQRSDATFRMFDYARGRELHIEQAVAVATAERRDARHKSTWLTNARTLLVTCPYFVLERIDLPPASEWSLHAGTETWVFVLDGGAQLGPLHLSTADAAFLQATDSSILTGADGLSFLVAYVGTAPSEDLLRAPGTRAVASPAPSRKALA